MSGGSVLVDGGDFIMGGTAQIRAASRDGSGQVTIVVSDFASAGDVVLGGEIRLDYVTSAPAGAGRVQPAPIVTQVAQPAHCTDP